MLNRYLRLVTNAKPDADRRPFMASECTSLQAAEKWRLEIVREVSKKVAEIQNPAMEEHRIRDLNDDINRRIREKYHWERRIRELGGTNHGVVPGPEMMEGVSIAGSQYMYFGAAKDLPGVRDLFQTEAPEENIKKRAEMLKGIDADYYGFRDEEDGVLLRVEAEAEKKMIADEVARHQDMERVKMMNMPRAVRQQLDDQRKKDAEEAASGPEEIVFRVHVPVPSQREIEAAIVAKRKADIMSKYVSTDISEMELEAKSLLNIAS
jgi:pre-mRNA-splicing factor ISY1